jgi:hypothetical protein
MIAEKMGQTERAQKELKAALETNPRFHLIYADEAQKQLALLNAQASSRTNEDKHAR